MRRTFMGGSCLPICLKGTGNLDLNISRSGEIKSPTSVDRARWRGGMAGGAQPLVERFDLFLSVLKKSQVKILRIFGFRRAIKTTQDQRESSVIQQDDQNILAFS